MLANNTKHILHKLVNNTIQTNRKQFRILFFTIALSAFLLFSIFSIGLTYLDLSRLQNTRLYGSEYDIVILNGFTDKQRQIMENDPKIQTVGRQAYCGYVKNTDTERTVEAGLLWADKGFWEKQKAPARTNMDGHYPQAENELMATKEVLKECGKGSLSVGDRFSMTYEDHTGVHTKEFLISGIWSGYGKDKENFYVSEKFYKQSGYHLETDGILQVKFKSNYVVGIMIEKLEESLGLSPRQLFQPSDYIEKSLTILLAVCGLCLMICLNAYLLIYNILYLSVSGKIRYYGLLQTLGMTQKQLIQFIRKQISIVGIAGIAIGVLSAALTSLFLVPYSMKLLGISLGAAGIHFYPLVLVLSIVTTSTAIFCGIQTPIRIAAGITAVEAVKYWRNYEPARREKGIKKGNLYWEMAKDQLKKDKKKTTIVFLSLATSLIIFYCLTTMIGSQGERTVYPNYWDADLIVTNHTQTTDDIASLQPAINETFISELEKMEGIACLHVVRGIPVSFPYDADGFSDFWIKGYTQIKPYLPYADTIKDYQKNPEKYYGMLKGIDEEEFEYLNGTLGNIVEKQDFLEGNTAILQYAGFEIPKERIGSIVSFAVENHMQEITIGAVSYEGSYGDSANSGANLIVSEKFLKSLTAKEPDILRFLVKYKQLCNEETENAIKLLLGKSAYSNDLSYTSKYEDIKMIQDSQGDMFEIGTVMALLLLSVGMLNYINTIAGSMQNRKLTFSIMESVGMSESQMIKMLICEGLLYAFGSVFLTLTIGTGITYFVFESMNYMEIPFSVPVFPVFCSILLVLLICILIPVVSYKKLVGNRSVVERLREYG